MDVYGIILAAGEGKRMRSSLAKPLHKVCGRTLLEWVIDASERAGSKKNIAVIGHRGEEVQKYIGDRVTYAWQREQLGTGHAVMQGVKPLEGLEGTVMVLYGDTPLISADTLKEALRVHTEEKRAATVISAMAECADGYGRIVREDGFISRIVEHKDASPEELEIREVNSGMYFFDIKRLSDALKRITNENAQSEYYITDVIEILIKGGNRVSTFVAGFEETLGVNDRIQLSVVEGIKNKALVDEIMLGGVTVIDPSSVYIEYGVSIGMDTVIYPNTLLRGSTRIGSGCLIGPGTTISDCSVGDGSEVVNSVLCKSEVGNNVHMGPYAYVRPNSKVGDNVKIGDFVEIKNATIGNGTKASHLTYIGDADVGRGVNFGCGTVVVNYDGKSKHRSIIEDNVFIGCNSNLVSPVTIRKGAYTAAGSTITDEVPEGALAIARSRQIVKEKWLERKGEDKQ